MHRVTIYHSNAVEAATLAGGSWDSALSLEKMRDPRPRLKARSTDAQLASTQFKTSLVAPKSLDGIQLISTNFSAAGKYKVSWYSDSGFTTLVDTTGWVDVGESIDWTDTNEWLAWEDENFWLGSEPFVDPDNLGRDIRIRFAETILTQYLKTEIDDTSNGDGYVEIGHLYVGQAYVPSINFEPASNRIKRVSNTAVRRTPAGVRFTNRRAAGQSIVIAFPMLPMAEVLGDIDDIVLNHDINKPIYLDIDPDNTGAIGLKTAFLSTLEELPDYALNAIFFGDDIGASTGFSFSRVM